MRATPASYLYVRIPANQWLNMFVALRGILPSYPYTHTRMLVPREKRTTKCLVGTQMLWPRIVHHIVEFTVRENELKSLVTIWLGFCHAFRKYTIFSGIQGAELASLWNRMPSGLGKVAHHIARLNRATLGFKTTESDSKLQRRVYLPKEFKYSPNQSISDVCDNVLLSEHQITWFLKRALKFASFFPPQLRTWPRIIKARSIGVVATNVVLQRSNLQVWF